MRWPKMTSKPWLARPPRRAGPPLASEDLVVDQADLVDPDRHRDDRFAGKNLAHGLHRTPVDDRYVDNPDAPVLAEEVRGFGDEAVGATFAVGDHLLHLRKGLE